VGSVVIPIIVGVDVLVVGDLMTFVGVGLASVSFNIAKYKWMRRPGLVYGRPWRL
tara:strand:- start:134 stop:298 length:165 start_codon:yes stop_codon:yes gene_type:complete